MTEQTKPPTPATTTPVIRWAENGVGTGECGWVGGVTVWLFQIWRPNARADWELIINLPGGGGNRYNKDLGELKKTADRVLGLFLTAVSK